MRRQFEDLKLSYPKLQLGRAVSYAHPHDRKFFLRYLIKRQYLQEQFPLHQHGLSLVKWRKALLSAACLSSASPSVTSPWGEQLSCLGEYSAQSFSNGTGELSYTCRWKPSGDEFGSHLLQLFRDPFSNQSKFMVLQPLPKLSCSPGPGSLGNWCFPI